METPRPSSRRIFIDASVLFAAAYAWAAARDLLLAGLRGEFTLLVSSLVLEETRRNLTKKAPQALPYYEQLLSALDLQIVDPAPELIERVAQVIDPKDAPIVAAAIAGQVAYLATYDRKHLLSHALLISRRFAIVASTPDGILTAMA